MNLYAFSDFHLSGNPPTKPMDIFGDHWKNHREKIITSWLNTIRAEDTVIMAGDLSWATHLSDALDDLHMLVGLLRLQKNLLNLIKKFSFAKKGEWKEV